jgi:universal stress protein A
VTLLRVEIPAGLEHYADLSDAALEHARRYLAGVKSRLRGLKAKVETLARIGSPAETILDAARELKATLIVLSTGRHAPLAHFIFGSVPETVVKHSPIPVLVLPAPTTEPAALETAESGSAVHKF